MGLSYDLISQFAKLASGNKKSSTESTVYGIVMVDDAGNKYVKLDGSDQLTPLAGDEQPSVDLTLANANEGERVSVLIKNHTATVTGNMSSPAARTGDVETLEDSVSEIQKFDILIGEQIQAQEGYIQKLQTDKANVGDLTAATAKITELEANKASVAELNVAKADITDLTVTKLDAEVANAKFATVEKLDATTAEIDGLKAKDAEIGDLVAGKADISLANINEAAITKLSSTFANIDFANIGEAAFNKLFAQSGIMENMTFSNGTVTGRLVGVTIIGDIIEGDTVVADKLVIQGEDGLYYKLNTDGVTTTAEQTDYNSLNGQILTAKSVTAEKVSVNDLVAFGATIGGFNIVGTALYSKVKTSVDNPTSGVYLDATGQMAIGNASNYLKFYRDATFYRQVVYDSDNDTYDIPYNAVNYDPASFYYGITPVDAEFGTSDNLLEVKRIIPGNNCTNVSTSEDEYTIVSVGGAKPYAYSMVMIDPEGLRGKTLYLKADSIESTKDYEFAVICECVLQDGTRTWPCSIYTGYLQTSFVVPEDASQIFIEVCGNNSTDEYAEDAVVTVKGLMLSLGANMPWTPYHVEPVRFTSDGYPVYTGWANERVYFCLYDDYKLDISAASVILSRNMKNIESAFDDLENDLGDAKDDLNDRLDNQEDTYNEFIAKFSKYIRFMEDENGNPSDTAMTIGSGDSAITLEIDNVKGLIFKKNGNEFGSWDGDNFHTGNVVIDVDERAQFGNFAFIPRTDGSLSFLKVGG